MQDLESRGAAHKHTVHTPEAGTRPQTVGAVVERAVVKGIGILVASDFDELFLASQRRQSFKHRPFDLLRNVGFRVQGAS